VPSSDSCVADRHLDRSLIADNNDKFLPAGDRRVQHVSLQEQIMLWEQQKHNGGILAALDL